MATFGTIPVTVHLDGDTFRALENIARRKQTTLRALIQAHLAASVVATPPPPRSKYGNRLTPEKVAQIEPMTREGLSAFTIAQRLGVTESAIQQRQKNLGLVGLRPPGKRESQRRAHIEAGA